ncbi:MAG: stage II sporulation protein R [Ruminococcaceae bacterium]|nr:stage II sporulation protein R [Oscillospiraceae bacterium]
MKKIVCALCIGFLCTLVIHSDFKSTEAALAKSVIRLHVLANSNSTEDQTLKLKVRDRIIKETSELFDGDNIFAARCDIEKNLCLIEQIARDEIDKNGYSYPVRVSLGMSNFPTKEYGELVLPAGSYEALKVEIGEAKGENWWCVLFPPLCFVDETCVTASGEYVEEIESGLGDGNKQFVSKNKNGAVELKFKTYELWQSGKRKIAMAFSKTKKSL